MLNPCTRNNMPTGADRCTEAVLHTMMHKVEKFVHYKEVAFASDIEKGENVYNL